jgi:hypothetical protein
LDCDRNHFPLLCDNGASSHKVAGYRLRQTWIPSATGSKTLSRRLS